MSEELRFFLISFAITFVIFCVSSVIEVFVLRAFKRLDSPKNLYYVASANLLGFIVTMIISSVIIFMLLTLGAAILGGVGSVAIGTLVGVVILLILIPILIFFIRFFLFRLFKVDETRFRLIYAIVSTIGVLAGMLIMWSLTIIVLQSMSINV